MEKQKVLYIGDGVAPTGFATVSTGILGNLDKEKYEIHHLAINYHGDPHSYDWKIYPAQLPGYGVPGYAHLGLERLRSFSGMGFDWIIILNDIWVINSYLERIKADFQKIPKIAVYFPVDAKELDFRWFSHFDIVTSINTYTEFAAKEVTNVMDGSHVNVVPHGVDTLAFRKLWVDNRIRLRQEVFKDSNAERLVDSFIVLNANRNQPRKRIELSMLGFKLFAENLPDTVFLYLHMGMKDMGFEILEYGSRIGISDKILVSNTKAAMQHVSIERLNLIYNVCDVGINTAIGEGWSLTNMEHAVTGAPQIVPNHSALTELYSDCGILLPVERSFLNQNLTVAGLVHENDVAEALTRIYNDRELYNQLSQKSVEKFGAEQYSWKYIAKNYWEKILDQE